MRSRMRGFTLIEMLIVVTIISILGAIAIPSYRNYAMRSHRAAATAALLRIQAAQEKYFLQYNAYTLNLSALPGPQPAGGLGIAAVAEGGRYNLTLEAGATPQSWLAQAAATGSQQTYDTKCPRFTIDQNGRRDTRDSSGSFQSQALTRECWR